MAEPGSQPGSGAASPAQSMDSAAARVAPKAAPKGSFWRSRAVRGVIYQVVLLFVVVLVGWYLTHNTLENMRTRGIQSGFDFFSQPAGFGIGESVIPYDSSEPYWKAFVVGF